MAKMGRKPKQFDWDRLDALCERNMELADCAEIMKDGMRTIERKIRQKYDMTFGAYRDQKMATTRLMIKQTALDHVKKGNIVMCIFLLKNWCGMADKVENIRSISLEAPSTINKIDEKGLTGEVVKLGVVAN